VRFECSHCRGILEIVDCEPGEAVACGHCGSAVAVPESRLASGAVVGDFVLRKMLGHGGMGAVYLGHQISLDRPAAVKILQEEFAADEVYIQNFIREARAAAHLNHPGIVQAYAVGEDEGLYYFAMEYVEGSTLKQVLVHSGRMVPERALAIVTDVAEALDFGWRNQQLVHRDVKPDNIMLTASSTVKLADLGLARWGADSTENSGEVHGTPQYISPEQLLSQSADSGADIYSLGATFYHMLSGDFPFLGGSPTEIAEKHLFAPLVPLTEIVPDVPAALSQIIEVMMAKRPAHRYADTGELLEDLRRVGRGEPPLRQPAPGGQEPIDLEVGLGVDDEAADSPAAPVGVPGIGGGGSGLKIRPATAPLPAGVLPGSDDDDDLDEPLDEPIEEATAKGGKPVVMLVLLFAVLLLGGGAAYYFLVMQKSGEETVAKDQGTEPAQSDELTRLRDLKASGASDAELAAALSEYAQTRDLASLGEGFWELAGPLVKQDLTAAMEAKREEQMAAWTKEHEDLVAAAAERKAEAEKRAQEEAEKQAREQAAQAKAELEKEKRDKRLAEQTKLREQAVALCRQNDYQEARLLFTAAADSDDPVLAEWAKGKQACINLARKLFDRIYNSKEKLAGTQIPQPGSTKPWVVTFISPKSISMERTRTTGYRDGKPVRETTRQSLALDETPETVYFRLANQLLSKDKTLNAKEVQLEFGAFLVSRARYLNEAKKRLAGLPGTQAMLAEIKLLAKQEQK
jgi:tRNA A-37 threonylcarbamoyl transferase component Bud32/flagellar biosynthesis/type III secretory pathway protein FliH